MTFNVPGPHRNAGRSRPSTRAAVDRFAVIGEDGSIVAVDVTQLIAAELLKSRAGRIVPSTPELEDMFEAKPVHEFTTTSGLDMFSIRTPKGMWLGYVIAAGGRARTFLADDGHTIPARGDWAAMVDAYFEEEEDDEQ